MVIVLKERSHLYNSLSTSCVYDSFDFYLFGLMNHVDTSQLERWWRVNSLDVNNRSCCGLSYVYECFDKLEAVPILCVERLYYLCFA